MKTIRKIFLLILLICLGSIGCVERGEEFEPKETLLDTTQDITVNVPIIVNGDQYMLEGILSLPSSNYNGVVVMLLQGSGASDLNGAMSDFPNAPMKDISKGLVKHGLATMRINKRYYQYSYLVSEKYTIYEEVIEDAISTLNILKNKYGFSDIVLVGHSLGSIVAFEIARQIPQIKAVVSMAGSPRKLQYVMYDQYSYGYKYDNNVNEQERKAKLKRLKRIIKKIDAISSDTGESYLGIKASYWKSLNEIDQVKLAKELEIPFLFMQGGKDFQVFSDTDYLLWKKQLTMKENVSFCFFPELNHYFMQSKGKHDTSEYKIEDHVSQDVIDKMAAWIATI